MFDKMYLGRHRSIDIVYRACIRYTYYDVCAVIVIINNINYIMYQMYVYIIYVWFSYIKYDHVHVYAAMCTSIYACMHACVWQ